MRQDIWRIKMKSVDKNRRLWPDQILTVNRLRIGMEVTKVYSHMTDYTEDYVIHEIKEDHFTYINEHGRTCNCFFADSNLTAYSFSCWNQSNYLIVKKEGN